MNHANVIYDLTLDSASVSSGPLSIFTHLVLLAPPAFLVFLGIRATRKSAGKVGLIMMAAGTLWLGFAVISMFVGPGPDYRELIKKGEYTETRGTISSLTKSTLIAGNPVATFEVAGKVFEYGRGSDNYELYEHSTKPPLQNGLEVLIWDHEGKILRIIEQGDTAGRPEKPGD